MKKFVSIFKEQRLLSHHLYQHQQVQHVRQIFVIIVAHANKLDMEQVYNVIVYQDGLVHDVNMVHLFFENFV
jgi:hypothetical protein